MAVLLPLKGFKKKSSHKSHILTGDEMQMYIAPHAQINSSEIFMFTKLV